MKGKNTNTIALFFDKNNIGTQAITQESVCSTDKGLVFAAALSATPVPLLTRCSYRPF